ncbi:tetratricopeptide repeat protein [Desulfovibrio sp. JC010]|uniref:tetratricopeptide repeat protein n=1 Tax=Desulfovibrio sp. JC010 TaxID=2593641 RepID=UPI0013D89026|nr:tetratricopeptide repeat protein [Desulfovibrio sp. JC010]NDV27238.1 tetratricopeptide repeat protein [Desulfovibrio sp. JC010]
MQSKIEWYQEVLALEPSSKVFFPLARLYVEMGNHEKAVTTLRMGLDRHPDYLEARLLLVETLAKLGRESEAKAAVAPLTRLFSSYPSFWQMWGASVSEGNSDVAGAMAFLFSALHGSPMSWSDVMAEGIKQLTGVALEGGEKNTESAKATDINESAGGFHRPEPESSDLLADEITEAAALVDFDGDSGEDLTSSVVMDSLRTKTMAEVLASQGDLEGALEIYRELLCKASDEEKEELMSFMADISSRISETPLDDVAGDDASKDPYFKHAKSKLMSTLELLAERLEARATR